MFIEVERFNAGDELIWTHGNGTTELVRFKSYLPNLYVSAGSEWSTFPPAPVCLVVSLKNGKEIGEITVPLAQLSRPT